MPKRAAESALWMRDVRQRLGVGIGDHRAVAVHDDLLGQAHEEHRGHDARAGLGLDDLQRRADGVGGRVYGARNQAVHLAEREHHRAEPDVVLEELGGVRAR